MKRISESFSFSAVFFFFSPEECGSLAKPTNQTLTDVTITKTNNDLYCYIITGPKYLTDLTHLWKKNRESKVCLKRNETEGIVVQNTIGQSLLICASRFRVRCLMLQLLQYFASKISNCV